MRKLYSPINEVELAILKSILQGENINYFVQNDYFGTLEIGPQIDLYNKKTIMVKVEQYERAKELINSYLTSVTDNEIKSNTKYTNFDKVRMCIEFLLFGWFIPGNRIKKKVKNNKVKMKI